ncbi:MAG: hypothetical protein C0501_21115 [Isosphaera sp.]|nr:hypothetical protein [Isosphaera sp.]
MALRHPRCAALAAVLAAGCAADEPIQTYDVPKAAKYDGQQPAPAGDYRILGAMFPANDPTWFFKFAGKADQVAKHEADFDKMLATVKLTPTGPQFDTPAGWKRLGPRVVKRGGVALSIYETVQFGPESEPLEVSVTRSGGGTLENVSRWYGQVGRPAPKPDQLASVTAPLPAADGLKGLRVDVSGPKNPATGGGPMMMGKGP